MACLRPAPSAPAPPSSARPPLAARRNPDFPPHFSPFQLFWGEVLGLLNLKLLFFLSENSSAGTSLPVDDHTS